MSRKGDSLTISLSESQRKELEQLALNMGFAWRDKGNISEMMRAIASGTIALSRKGKAALSFAERKNIRRAIAELEKLL